MFAEGRTLADEGLQIAETVQHPMSLICASWGAGLLALRQGDLPRALALLERAVAICQDAARPAMFPAIAAALGAAYALGGRLPDALPLLTSALEQTMTTELGCYQAILAIRCSVISPGRRRRRLPCVPSSWRVPIRNRATRPMRSTSSARLPCIGSPRRLSPPTPTTSQALALAEELGMRPLQAHCHRGFGMLYATTGQREQARAALSTAIAMYRGMAMTFWLPETEAVLAQVDA